MTPQEVLARVLEAGGRVIPDPERPRLLVPPALRPLVAEHREALKELVRQLPLPAPQPTPVPALCRALRAWYDMTAQQADGDLPTVEDSRALLSRIGRLQDVVGPAVAEAVERQEARAYYQESGRCPFCGEPTEFHEPGEKREAAS